MQSIMTKSIYLYLSAFALLACAEPGEPDGEFEDSEIGATVENLAPPPLECSSRSVLAVLDDPSISDCGLAGTLPSESWKAHQMFDDSSPELAAWTEPVPARLARYCSYEYVRESVAQPEDFRDLFTALAAYPHTSLDTAAIDCSGEKGQGTGLNDPAITQTLAEAFLNSVDWVSGEMLASTSSSRVAVEVGILDTVPAAGEGPVQNDHGLQMADIVAQLSCPGAEASCLDAIRHYAAMPRSVDQRADWSHGGQFGTVGDLSRAIVASVGQWRERRLEGPEAAPRLVLNLSLGWAGDAPVNTASDRAPMQALEDALNFAACNGVVVIAAAGNVSEPGCLETGALAPAIYQTRPAPDAQACAALGFSPIDEDTYPVFGAERPLVYAVGGVDGRDIPVANARPGGTPPLVAAAAHAAIETPNGFTTPLTGTSVSTAVVSGTASLLWSYDPSLTPDMLMDLIHEHGYDTGFEADFQLGEGTRPVRRTSVCASLAGLCAGLDASSCPQLDCVAQPAPADGHLGPFFEAVGLALADPAVVSFTHSSSNQETMCSEQGQRYEVVPQPEHPACPNCILDVPPGTVDDDDVVSMQIDTTYAGSVVSITLVTRDAVGTPSTFGFDSSVVSSVNDPSSVTQVYIEAPDAVTATLDFGLADGTSQDGPIPVNQL